MKYFVSIENTSYFYWQVELLIESFKMHGLQDDLCISIAENMSPKLNANFKNLTSHPHIFLHENVGRERNYLPLNRIYSLEKLVREGNLEFPFTLIHSDMVLRNPLSTEKYKDFNIITNTYQAPVEEIDEIINFEEMKNNLISSGIIGGDFEEFYYSHPIIFNHVKGVTDSFKENFFKYLIYEIEVLLLESNKQKSSFEMAVWKKNLLNATGHYKITGDVLSANITDQLKTPFVHYNKGIPPVFNKRFFKNEDSNQVLLSGINPFKQLIDLRSTSENSEYVAKVAESYLRG